MSGKRKEEAKRWFQQSRYDLKAAQWKGNGANFGAMVPVAQSFTVAGEGGGWRRESYLLASEPPASDETQDFLSVQGLQRKGR